MGRADDPAGDFAAICDEESADRRPFELSLSKLLRVLPFDELRANGDVFHPAALFAIPMILARMPSITSSAPPPIEARRPSRYIRETLFSQV